MPLPIEQVQHIATLARLELTDAELTRYREQLSAILDYFQQLQNIETDKIPPTTSGVDLNTALRTDQVHPGLDLLDVLENAADIKNNQFRVPPVFE